LNLFTADDIYKAICGSSKLNFNELKRTTKYEDFTTES